MGSPNRLRRIVSTLVLWLLVPYVLLCAWMYLTQDRLIFYPTRQIVADPGDVGLEYEDVHLETEAGERVHGWWVPHPGARANVLFLHGNAGNVSGRLATLEIVHQLGLSCLILDYPGYGKSDGRPSEAGCYRAALAAERHLRSERGALPLVVWGRSLGGGVATWLAAERPVDVLVLESTFTSLPALARRIYPWLPVGLLCRSRFDSLGRIGRAGAPILFLHSPDDEIVPWRLGRALYEAAPAPKRFHDLDGDHGGGFLASGQGYRAALESFLREHLSSDGR